jgi:ribose-phosphate pyrophosphokinase
MRSPLLLILADSIPPGLAPALGLEASELFVRHFPDGEALVRIDADVRGRDVAIAASLHHPDTRTLPLLFAADAARELGAQRVGLVAPYLAYMRQDARFQPGEAISSRTYAKHLSSAFDFLVTVDPHLHRWSSLDQIYTIPSRVVPAAPEIARWITQHVANPLVVGPDAESEQWVAHVATLAGAPFTVMDKTRRGDRDVGVAMREMPGAQGCTPVLVDDIISTGHTLIAAAQALQAVGLPSPRCVGVHALCTEDALHRMRAAGIAEVVSCDTVPHSTNAIRMAPALAAAVRDILQ